MNKQEQIRAVGLFSGGLDSTLAAKILLEQNIKVTGLHFRTGFSYIERNRALKRDLTTPTRVEKTAVAIGMDLEIIDVSSGYIPVVLDPRYGYGSEMNPCVDCRIFLLRQAKAWMKEHSYHFVFTGEVVGQRPKSQMRPTLNTVERESGLQGYLLRPLSARLLDPTIPEQRGWVDRQKLYDISGRGRKRQIALAEQFGIVDYQQPSGGCCFLIDQNYSRRLRDFVQREGGAALTPGQAQLLAIGRHIRLPSGQKVIVGRREQENDYLEDCEVSGVLLRTVDVPGPVTLVPGEPTPEAVELAARITASYSDGKERPSVRIAVGSGGAKPKWDSETVNILTVEPMKREIIKELMV